MPEVAIRQEYKNWIDDEEEVNVLKIYQEGKLLTVTYRTKDGSYESRIFFELPSGIDTNDELISKKIADRICYDRHMS